MLQAALCAAVRRGSAVTGKRDTRRTARRSEAKCDRRPSGENSAGCGRLREVVPDGDGRYSALNQTACIRERMAHLTTKRRRECRRCARAERRKRLVQQWAVPIPNAKRTAAKRGGARGGRPRRQSRDWREMRLSRSDQVARSRRLSPEGAARGRGRTQAPTPLFVPGVWLGRYCP